VQAQCNSDHNQLAGISKLNPQRHGGSLFTNRRYGAGFPGQPKTAILLLLVRASRRYR
jgi:hypothetical protein